MGYYSDVALIMNKETYLYGLKWMDWIGIREENNCLHPTYVNKVIERTIYSGEKSIILFYPSVKWYYFNNRFIDLVNLYNFLDTIGKDKYGLIRIGEEIGDVEFDGDDMVVYNAEVYPVTALDLGDSDSDKIIKTREDIGSDEVLRVLFNKGYRKVEE